MDGLKIEVTSITIATPDPRALAAFYSRLLNLPITSEEGPRPGEPEADGWAQIRNTSGPTLNFEYERVWTTPIWPSKPGTQHATQHIDIHVSDLEAATTHAIYLKRHPRSLPTPRNSPSPLRPLRPPLLPLHLIPTRPRHRSE